MTDTTVTGFLKRFWKRWDERLLALFYILTTVVATFSLCASFPSWISTTRGYRVWLKAAYVPFVCVSAYLWIWGRGAYRKNRSAARAWLIEYLAYIILMFVMTSLIYFVQGADRALIMRGYEKLAFQAFTVFITISAFYIFGQKAVDHTFWGFVLFYVINIIFALFRYGITPALHSIRDFIVSFGQANGFMKALELHDAVFAFGVFIIYYYLEGVKKHPVKFALAVLFFLLGFKRIGALAILVALPLGSLLKRYIRDLKKAGLILGVTIVLAGFAYIAFVKLGGFSALTRLLGINSMGRDAIYDFVEDCYTLSPSFLGRGFEYITQLFKNSTHPSLNLANIAAVHNSYLTVFIEFGFFGYFLWTGYWLVWHHGWTARFGKKVMLAQLLVSVYLFVTYLTDNTSFYFSTGLVARLMPMMFIGLDHKQTIESPGPDTTHV
ncbi:MAG: O-antigen ligase family protein [Clostridiales bacterium]|nr:O-antigen ligase family protein [Clostridiales bacterium]